MREILVRGVGGAVRRRLHKGMIAEQTINRIFMAGWAALALALLIGSWGTMRLARCAAQGNTPRTTAPEPVRPALNPAEYRFDGSVFRKSGALPLTAPSPGNALRRYRLAGTFFAVGMNQQSRRAILDDLQKQEQMLVSEGDQIDGAAVVHLIMSDKVILRRGTAEEEILLSFTGTTSSNTQQAAYSGSKIPEGEENRFGKRVGDKRWVLTRESMLNYYKEVLNNTDRLAKVYDSLKPVYQGGNIAGYTLVIEGEAEMFNAFGLQEGDIIRQVNSLPMTSQNRAEYFINEFVKNRVNGFVLDIERSGKKDRLIYMVR